jgi:branched-subunit amino acid ABC-type transport system permease component
MKKFLIIIAVVVVVAGALVLFMSSSMLGRAVKAGSRLMGRGSPAHL